jgi:cytochrome c-type biogenesis protein
VIADLHPSYALAFLAGLVSFLSPCVFPLVPVYAAYLSGQAGRRALAGAESTMAMAEAGVVGGSTAAGALAASPGAAPRATRVPVLANGTAFVVGFSVVFVALYYVLRVLEVTFFISHQQEVNLIAGAIIVVLALNTMGVIRVGFLLRERRVHLTPVPGLAGAFLLGISFAAGWIPCTSPQLGAILQLAQQGSLGGLPFMLAYCLGLAVPFLVVAALTDRLQGVIRTVNRHMGIINLVAGSLLLLFGLLLMFDRLTFLNRYSFQSPFDI